MPYAIILSIVSLLSVLTLLISYITYRLTFRRGRCVKDPYDVISKNGAQDYRVDMTAKVTRLLESPFESVNIISHDGLKLHARLYFSDNNAPFEILVHGYRSLSLRDFSGGACEAMDRGHNILLIDQRAHGESEGKTISFGALEAQDCLGWIDFLCERFGKDVKIILVGISMGGATVLLTAGSELPKNVRGVIADCPYSSAKEIIMKVGREKKYPMHLLYPFLKLGARLYGKFSIDSASPIEAIDKVKLPVLLIHGEADTFVPCEMSIRLKNKNPDISFHPFPNADHGTSYCIDPDRYRLITAEFIKKILEESI